MNTPALPLIPPPLSARELAGHREALLVAFKHLGLRRMGHSFEQALASPALRIALRVWRRAAGHHRQHVGAPQNDREALMKGVLNCKWMCEGCDTIHDTQWDAEQCCPPEVTEIWHCPICNDIHYEEQDAILCCGFDPDAPPPPPSAEELERAGQMRLMP